MRWQRALGVPLRMGWSGKGAVPWNLGGGVRCGDLGRAGLPESCSHGRARLFRKQKWMLLLRGQERVWEERVERFSGGREAPNSSKETGPDPDRLTVSQRITTMLVAIPDGPRTESAPNDRRGGSLPGSRTPSISSPGRRDSFVCPNIRTGRTFAVAEATGGGTISPTRKLQELLIPGPDMGLFP